MNFPENRKTRKTAILRPYSEKMINYTSLGFASIYGPFSNRDANHCVQVRRWPIFRGYSINRSRHFYKIWGFGYFAKISTN